MDKLRPMTPAPGEDMFAHILNHHRHPEKYPLTEKQQEIADRWYEAFHLLCAHWSPLHIVRIWKEKKGLSHTLAYADIKNARLLFADVLKNDNEAERAIWLMDAKDLLKRSKERGDRKTEVKALELIAKYSGFAKADDLNYNPDKLANINIEYTFPDVYMDYMKKLWEKGAVDLNYIDITGEINDIDENNSSNEGDN